MREDVEMTFGEHLEDLRRRVIYALLGIIVGGIGCGVFYTDLFNALAYPFEDAARKLANRLETEYVEGLGPNPPQPVELPEDLQEEIRRLRHPRMIPEGPTTLFTTIVILCVAGGFIVSSPWVAYQVWAFVGVGLHSNERRFVFLYGPVSLLLFFVGSGFSFFVLRFAFQALMGIGTGMRVIEHTYTLAGYLKFLLWMSIAFGLAFETPLVVLFLAQTGIVEVRTLFRKQRVIIMIIIILAAVLSPGQDPITMIAMGVPMILLYEIGLLLAWITVRKKERQEAESEDHGDPGDDDWSKPDYDTSPPKAGPSADDDPYAGMADEPPSPQGQAEPPAQDPTGAEPAAGDEAPPADDQADPGPGPDDGIAPQDRMK